MPVDRLDPSRTESNIPPPTGCVPGRSVAGEARDTRRAGIYAPLRWTAAWEDPGSALACCARLAAPGDADGEVWITRLSGTVAAHLLR